MNDYYKEIELWTYANNEDCTEDVGASFCIKRGILEEVLNDYFDGISVEDFLNEYTWDNTEFIFNLVYGEEE